MQVNWFTVIAQIINFLILVWLLKKYLYKPVLDAIDTREKRIAAQLEDAKAKEADALKERSAFEEKNKNFEQEKAGLLEEASKTADAERASLLKAAKADAEALGVKLKAAFKEEQQNTKLAITQKTQDEVFEIVRKTLADLSSQELEAQTVKQFIQKLHAMNEEEKTAFKAAFSSSEQPVMVTTAYDLHAAQRALLEETIHEMMDTQPSFQYKKETSLVSGIEMNANGYKLTWNIDAYLDAFEKSMGKINQETITNT